MTPIKIAVASGKGGTGKTMVATSLASVLVSEHRVQLIDCDVEAPNAHLFLKPSINWSSPAVIMIPEINEERCTACGKCVEVCEFHALAQIGTRILVFPQLCHGCGTCSLYCPEDAISEIPHQIGEMSRGLTTNGVDFLMGELTISEPMATPIIRQLKGLVNEKGEIIIFDSPPGASCAVVATVHDADYVLLVTEPTPFGLHDLKQMIGVLKATGTPGGVIINRDGIGNQQLESYLEGTPYPILMKIPYDSEIALGLASGNVLTEFMPQYQSEFRSLHRSILEHYAKVSA